MLRADGVVYFYLFLLIIRCVTSETDDKRCVKGGKWEKKKTIAVIRLRSDELEKFWQGLRDSIRILDLSEAQEQDESKRQTMFMSIVMGA